MRSLVKKLSKIIAITFFTLYCLIWLFSPVIVNYVINNHGLPQGYSLTSDSTVRYNPFTAHLTISDLEMQLENQTAVLKVAKLDAELHLHQLLFDRIYLAEFEVNGIYIPVVMTETSLTVAGFDLLAKENDASNAEQEAQQQDSSEEKSTFAYQLVIPKFNLTNAIIELEHLGQSHRLELDSLSLASVSLSQQSQDLELLLSSHINQAPLNLAVNAGLVQQQGLVEVELNLGEFSLHHLQAFLPETLKALNGKLSYSSAINIELSTEKTLLSFDKFLFAVDNFHVEQDGLAVDVADQQIESNELSIELMTETPVNVNAVLAAEINDVSVQTLADKGRLANVESIAVENISAKFAENTPNVTIGTLTVGEGVFSQHMTNELPALASFKQLALNDIGYEQNNVSIDNITISGLIANLLLDENKQLSTLVALEGKEGSGSEEHPSTGESAAEEKALAEDVNEAGSESIVAFSLGELKLLDAAQIDFKDKSVTPHYERNVQIDTLSLASVNTAKPELESIFNLKGKSDKYANFDVKGRGHPFAEKQSFQLDALIKEVSLPSVSSYIKDALKYEIESGQLDVTIAAGLNGSEIDGDVDLLLRGVDFTAADDHEAGTVTDQTSVPFNVALGMLKDSDGNVELSVPLSGDTSSPSFGFTGFLTLLVKQATMSAAKDYLITTFVPYASVMKVAMAAGEFALKLRINDLNYLPQQVELSPEQIEFSRQMSVMLQDQPDINVKLCAIATPADIGVTSAEQAHLADNVQRLKVISQQRVDTFKAYMVEQLNVNSAKLLLCTPQIDSTTDANSRIEFVI